MPFGPHHRGRDETSQAFWLRLASATSECEPPAELLQISYFIRGSHRPHPTGGRRLCHSVPRS
jgi:hypothetical protein